MKHLTTIFLLILISISGAPRPAAPPRDTIRVLCLYGSVPAKGYWNIETFYGPRNVINMVAKLHGGHVGIEFAPDKVLSFQPRSYGGLAASGHMVSHFKRRNFNSWFRVYSADRMWSCLGNHYNNIDSLRRAVFVIPITAAQRKTLDSLVRNYTATTPYDYAFLGMRCASSTYDVLQTAGILPKQDMTWYNVFTTQHFRYLLYREYLRNKDNGWQLYTCKGSVSRKWETDIDDWTNFHRDAAQNPDTARIARVEPDSIALAPLIYLASDALGGRHIGGIGITLAANYIESELRKAGAKPAPGAATYVQTFNRIISRRDLYHVGQDLRYNVSGFEPLKNFTLKNIVAYIPGTDPILRRQYVMLSAHYDHIGIADYAFEVDGKQDSIYNGARDNATGTAAVIAAAHYFGKYPPRRSVLLVFFTAEEEGEFGSKYYADHPLVALGRTIFDLNVDNAGYNTTHAICLFGLGRTSADSLIRLAAMSYGLAVLAEPPDLELFDRSDNANFAKAGVPAPCFSMGMTKWDKTIDTYYHRRGDEVGNMDLDYVVKFIRAYILSAQYIANDPAQPRWTPGDAYEKAWLRLYGYPSH